jgi:ADP-ribosylglycohydrolase
VTSAESRRAADVLLGAAVGDALGWPQEWHGNLVGGQRARDQRRPEPVFHAWERTSGHYTSRRPDPVAAGEYSDDTQLLCATARACLHGPDWVRWLTDVELPTWPLYQRGGGGAVLRACRAWADGRTPWDDGDSRGRKLSEQYFRAGANGVAMRIAPHVLVEASLPDVLARVVRDGVLTHGHPRALLGALTYAAALHEAVHSEATIGFGSLLPAAARGLLTFDEVAPHLPTGWPEPALTQAAMTWTEVRQETSHLIEQAARSVEQGALSNADQFLASIGCSDPAVNGAGTITGIAAIYLAARFAARPLTGLLTAAFVRKGDTDTLASMTGGLLAAVQGTDWMEGLDEQVQDNPYLKHLAGLLSSSTPAPGAGAATFAIAAPTAKELVAILQNAVTTGSLDSPTAGTNSTGVFPDGRSWELIAHDRLAADTLRLRLRLDHGQTALIDITVRPSTTSPPPSPGVTQPEPRLEEEAAPSDRVPASSGTGAGVQLGSSNLRANAAFYAKLLDRPVNVGHGTARITDWLLLHASDRRTSNDDVILRFIVDDLTAAARVLGVDPGAGPLRGHDPDGRRVEVVGR